MRIAMMILYGAALLFLNYAMPAGAYASEPTDQVRRTVEQIRTVFKDKGLTREERDAKLRALVDDRFDFEEMAKRSLGRYWRERTPEERKEFVSLYADLLKNIYLKKIRKREEDIEKHENDRVAYLGESTDGSYASVKTRIITYAGSEIPVEYKLLEKNGQWPAYDVLIEGVSLVNNYRTQFSQIIRSGSYEELVKRLKEKKLSEPAPRSSAS